MKSNNIPLLFAAVIVLGSVLSSCVVPYDANVGTTTTTITDYQPGYRTTSLPNGYQSEVISGSTYYYNDGNYFRPESGGYVVVSAPRTSRYYSDYDSRRRNTTYRDSRSDNVRVITTLPSGYREISHGGENYYQSGGQYYRRQGSGYLVVNRPF